MATGCGKLSSAELRQLDQGRQSLAAARYAECDRILTPLINAHHNSSAAGEPLYLRGQARLKNNRRKEARNDLEAAQKLTNNVDVRTWSQVQLGNMFFDDQDYGRACHWYAMARKNLPSEEPSDRALYQYGVALQRHGRFDEARTILAEVYVNFPGSQYAVNARNKRSWKHNYFSVQCGVFNRIENAHQAASKLRQKGLDALAFPDDRNSSKRYVVRVGRYEDYHRARRMLDRVRGHQTDGFLVP